MSRPADRSAAQSAHDGAAPRTAVLLVEDEQILAEALAFRLEAAGCRCVNAPNLEAARRELRNADFDVVLLDLRLPDGHGFELLEHIKEAESSLPVVVLTAVVAVEDAVQAMKLGAADYLIKPDDPDQALLAVEKALVESRRARQLAYARERDSHRLDGSEYVGNTERADNVRTVIRRIAQLQTGDDAPTVLILGETGTGKNLAARLIHLWGPRHDRPFVHVDCASLPENLIESELFGHEKGAFTQAVRSRTGLIEAAEDGTLFLDEIGELPLDLQAKLLAVLDRRLVRRVGSSKERRVEARFIAATNRDLAAKVGDGSFRADLYYRLNVLGLTLPPLREMGEDVVLLARNRLADITKRYDIDARELSEDACCVLRAHSWPGNVRELGHVLERAALTVRRGQIRAADLGLGAGAAPGGAAAGGDGFNLHEAEARLIRRALEASGGNVSQAARLLGLSRGSLRVRLDRLGIGTGS